MVHTIPTIALSTAVRAAATSIILTCRQYALSVAGATDNPAWVAQEDSNAFVLRHYRWRRRRRRRQERRKPKLETTAATSIGLQNALPSLSRIELAPGGIGLPEGGHVCDDAVPERYRADHRYTVVVVDPSCQQNVLLKNTINNLTYEKEWQ